jgi:hypothetical protein
MRNALIRMAIVATASGLLIIATLFAPVGLRRIDAFNVQRVEVTGTHYLTAEAAVNAAGITHVSNIFDDAAPWLESLLAHPLVLDAQMERRVPATLMLRIIETKPVAFARTPEIRAIDENGRVLPADPGADGMDLPVLTLETRLDGQGTATDEQTLQVAAFLGVLGRAEPGLLGWISEVGMQGGAVRLVLRNASDAEVLVPADATPERLRELHLTIAELATPRYVVRQASADAGTAGQTAISAEPELARVRRIDGRFLDQIVVALHGGKN